MNSLNINVCKVMKRKTLIEEDKKKIEISNKIDEIYLIMKENVHCNNWGVLDGFSSTILFLSRLYIYSKDDKILDDLYNRINLLISYLDKIKLPTICGGYAGICWLFRYLYKEKLVESNNINEVLDGLEKYITKTFYNYYINDTDFLHGGLGIAFYFLLSDTNYSENLCKVYLDRLDKNKQNQKDGSCMWTTQVYNGGENEAVANLSLSHGMASIIIFLAYYHSKTNNHKAKRLLQQAIEFYKRNTNPNNFYSMYSNWIKINSPSNLSESRLAWCYGDLGIAKALNYAGVSLGNSDITNFSFEVLNKTIPRFMNSHVEDASFCHGSSGISHIYNHFYQITGYDAYKNSAIFWLNDTLNRIKYLEVNSSFSTELNDVCSILTGLSGVGLSLLSSIEDKEDNWNELLLLL